MVEKEVGKRRIETDVVIVGYSGAGATAAISAHDNGARVTILEKMPTGGGNTCISAGVLMGASDMEAVEYIAALCFGTTEHEVIETFVEKAIKNRDWIEEIGGGTEPYALGLSILYPTIKAPCWSNIPGGDAISWYNVRRSKGESEKGQYFGAELWKLLSTNVERRGIRVMTSTPAKELITNERGEVIGVNAERGGEKISILAKRAVILACGGFEYNEAMKQAFLPCGPFYALGSLGNTGDGIMMAQKVGAALWHMAAVACVIGFKAPEYESAFHIMMCSERHVYVDRDGKRFVDEAGVEMHNMGWAVSLFDFNRACFPRIPTYAIFDEIARRKGPLARPTGANLDYEWSLDNSKEIARGWISQGKTISALAIPITISIPM